MNAHPITITTGDCVTGLEALPAGSVDLVIVDPPYNIGIDHCSSTTAVVCVERGRRFHGFELREEFAAISRRRAAQAAATPPAQPTGALGK